MTRRISWATAPLDRVLARWDVLAIHWKLDGDERSALLGGVSEGPIDVTSTYGSPAAERRMRLLVALEPILDKVFGDERQTRVWLRRSNLNLQGRTPLEVMAQSPEWIAWLIDALGIAA